MTLEMLIFPAGILLGVLVGALPMSRYNRGKLSLGANTAHKIMALQVIFALIVFFASVFINEAVDPPRWSISEADWSQAELQRHWIELAVMALWACFPVTYIASYITGLRGRTVDGSTNAYAIVWPLLGVLFLMAWLFAHLLYACAIHDSCL